MARLSHVVPALALAALLVFAPAAGAADPKAQPASTGFDLPTDDGRLRAHLDVFNEEFTLEIRRKDGYASYKVDGEATEAGLKTRFGRLGTIDLAFQPTEVELERPPKRCVGPPSRFSDGVLTGTVSFVGEGEYVRIDETRVEARLEVWRESEWRCPRHKRRTRASRAPHRIPFASRPSTEDKDPAILTARKRGCRCSFVALSIPDDRMDVSTYFYGAKFVKKEGMEITRVTGSEKAAAASTFTFNHKAGTASVHPPGPIAGSGHFERRPHGRDLWRSSIRVPLLGAEPIDMREGGYHAVLVKDEPEFR
jgi:hypothetical protein